jgi:hypothetical protein
LEQGRERTTMEPSSEFLSMGECVSMGSEVWEGPEMRLESMRR